MSQSANIEELFYGVADAIEEAQAQMESAAPEDLNHTNNAITTVFTRMEALLAAFNQLPQESANNYHAPLERLLALLEEFHHTLETSRSEIKTELDALAKHRRAFNAYLSFAMSKK